MDEFDKRIVTALQENGRATNIDLAKKVGLTHSACARRIQRLEKAGVIRGYRAMIDREALGLSVRAFVGVMCRPDVDFRQVARGLGEIDRVISCYIMSGDFDIMIEVIAEDMKEYSSILLDEVLKTPGVQASRGALTLEEITSIY